MHKTAFKLKDDLVKSRCKALDLREQMQSERTLERIQIEILTAELVRKNQAPEECEAAQRVDRELIERLESCCEELRLQRLQPEEQLAKLGEHNRNAADQTR